MLQSSPLQPEGGQLIQREAAAPPPRLSTTLCFNREAASTKCSALTPQILYISSPDGEADPVSVGSFSSGSTQENSVNDQL